MSRSFAAALVAVLVIGLLNVTLGLLLKLITLPLGILTLGLFFLVINAFILKLAGRVAPGFYVSTGLPRLLELWCWRCCRWCFRLVDKN